MYTRAWTHHRRELQEILGFQYPSRDRALATSLILLAILNFVGKLEPNISKPSKSMQSVVIPLQWLLGLVCAFSCRPWFQQCLASAAWQTVAVSQMSVHTATCSTTTAYQQYCSNQAYPVQTPQDMLFWYYVFEMTPGVLPSQLKILSRSTSKPL